MRRPRGDSQPGILDFTSGTLPADVASGATWGGNLWRRTGVGSVELLTSGDPILERFGSSSAYGIRTFLGYDNRVGIDTVTYGPTYVQTIAFDRLAGKFPTYVAAVAPYGGSPVGAGAGGVMLGGSNGAEAGQGRQASPSIKVGGGVSSCTIYSRPTSAGPNGAPAVVGDMQAIASPTNYTDLLNTASWDLALGRGTNIQPYLEIRSTGAGSDLGDRQYWGAQCAQRGGSKNVYAWLPLTDDAVTSQTVEYTGSLLSSFIVNGVLDIQGEFVLPFQGPQDVWGIANEEFHILAIPDDAGNVIRLWAVYTASEWRFYFQVDDGGVPDTAIKSNIDGLFASDGVIGGVFGSSVYFRLIHDSAAGTMTLRLGSGGAYFTDEVQGATITLGTATSLWLGSDETGSEIFDGLFTKVQGSNFLSRGVPLVEGYVAGNSIVSTYTAGTPQLYKPATATLIYTYDESVQIGGTGRAGIWNGAVQGYTIQDSVDDFAAWTGSKGALLWAICHDGINDVTDNVKTSAQILAEMTAQVTAMRNAGVQNIGYALMAPAAGYIAGLGGAAAAVQATYNAVQAGIEANTIGADFIVDDMYYSLTNTVAAAGDYTVILSDGTGTRDAYDNGDGLHLNLNGKIATGTIDRAALVAEGFLP